MVPGNGTPTLNGAQDTTGKSYLHCLGLDDLIGELHGHLYHPPY